VVIVTGSRAEFGLLRPMIDGVIAHRALEALVVAAGSHLLPPARTVREVELAYTVAAHVRLQRAAAPPPRTAAATTGAAMAARWESARDVGRGVDGFARVFQRLRPDWVVVLGDRVEAFAAATAAALGGVAVAHVHGGDRAEGIADESMRHAITKLSHLHCAATPASAERLVRLGERPEHVHVTGSPAIDGLDAVEPMSDEEARALGDPRTIVLHHPSGLPPDRERRMIHAILYAVDTMCPGPVLALAPNHDPGREVIEEALRQRCRLPGAMVEYAFRGPCPVFRARRTPRAGDAEEELSAWHWAEHLPRDRFVALLKRLRADGAHSGGLLIGNSSAGLIEARALGVRVVNVGPRQDGRERGPEVVDVPETDLHMLASRVDFAWGVTPSDEHPYGDGRAGRRIADLLAAVDPRDERLLRKRNTY
jgi:UDP-hydrolysing UDP-N-acetyl-D-glucosamine 2-epimerase